MQAPVSDKALAGAAGACTLLLSARFFEYLVYETKEDAFGKGPIARVLDLFSSFMGQVSVLAASLCSQRLPPFSVSLSSSPFSPFYIALVRLLSVSLEGFDVSLI